MNQDNLYFIALIPNREIRKTIIECEKDFARRFNSKKALKVYPHITLKAPFKLSANHHLELINWFSNLPVKQHRFLIKLKNFGAFHNKNNPVIYINPVVTEGLKMLQKEIIASFEDFHPELLHPVDLTFKPHLTVAYRDLSPEMFSAAWKEYKEKSFNADFNIDAFYLLQHDTKKWNLISTYNLL